MPDCRIKGRLYRIAFLVFVRKALINLNTEVNASTLVYASRLGYVRPSQQSFADYQAGAGCQSKKFAATVLDPDEEAFVAYVASLTYRRCQFIRPDFTIISSPNSATEVSGLTRINNHAIDLVENKQTLYGPI